MRNGWMGRLGVVAAVAALLGCESDDARLQRLESEAGLAYLTVLAKRHRADSLHSLSITRRPRLDSAEAARFDAVYAAAVDSLLAAERRATLAQRDLDRFLR